MNNILTLTSPVTESLTSPRTDTDRIECMPVPDEQRAAFWPQQFGSIPQWITLEPHILAGWTGLQGLQRRDMEFLYPQQWRCIYGPGERKR